MSWSFSAIGKAASVAKRVEEKLQEYPCQEPEQSIRAKVGEALQVALAAFPEGSAVRIEASGSQSMMDGKAINTLSVSLQPIYGFVE